MSAWNTSPPRGGPMVAVKGFPGPLYPPDHPKASKNSAFVEAMKRWAARCGAWPWTPDQWDQQYSNRFAHGDGWNHPTHAGIEGLQHWSGTIDPTGNVGEKTFNFARSVKVPQGRTHAGEMAYDSVCVQLTNQAWEQKNPPPPATLGRSAALELAIDQLGVKESPAGSNIVEYSDWYGLIGPWCSMFVSWCWDGPDPNAPGSPSFDRNQERYAYVPYIVSDARQGRNGLSVASSPSPGDLVCYDWERNGEYDHVGFFEEWLPNPGTFNAIEGNTSTSDNSNGGAVMRRQRSTMSQGTVFVRVAE